MKLKKDTWHYRNWEAWLTLSRSKRSRMYNKQFFCFANEDDLKTFEKRRGMPLKKFIVEEQSEDHFADYIVYEPEMRQANLCMYFWAATVRGPALRVAHWLGDHPGAAVPLFIISLILFVGGFWNLLDSEVVWWHPYVWTAVAFAIIAAGATAFLFLSYVWTDKVWPALRKRHYDKMNQPEPEKGPNIVMEHIKAKKSKMCPILEFED